MDCKKIGSLIYELRKDKNMTQKQIADLMNISDKTISKWERGLGCPDISLLPELSQILGVSIDQNPDAWKQAIQEDQTPWKHVLDQRSEVAKTFGVSSVPRVFLIDPKGVIVAVNLYGEELEQCLEEIFSK